LIDSGILMRHWPLITFIKTPLTTLNDQGSIYPCASLPQPALAPEFQLLCASAYLPYLRCFHLAAALQS
jgi:hypothetical protein